jgi:hypothetical protein
MHSPLLDLRCLLQPSDAVKRRKWLTDRGHQLVRIASLRPPVNTLAGLGSKGLVGRSKLSVTHQTGFAAPIHQEGRNNARPPSHDASWDGQTTAQPSMQQAAFGPHLHQPRPTTIHRSSPLKPCRAAIALSTMHLTAYRHS